MWAHYAKNHAGVCLTFEIPYKFILEKMLGCAAVQYNQDALFEALRRLNPGEVQSFNRALEKVVSAMLTTKSSELSYECESRLVSHRAGFVAFDKAWLRQICWGLRISDFRCRPSAIERGIERLSELHVGQGRAR